MPRKNTEILEAAAAVKNGLSAKELLDRQLNPAVVRVLASRADELRFDNAADAVGVAEVALEALNRLPRRLQRPGIATHAWAVYGSILRTRARFDEAELALATAARWSMRCRQELRADLERRFAYLRADQGNLREMHQLLASLLAFARRVGGRRLGKELVNAGAILVMVQDYEGARSRLEEAIGLLPANGDHRHVSAVANLARCHLELSSLPRELSAVACLIRQAGKLMEPGSYSELKLRWLDGKLQHRLENYDASLELFESARRGIEERGDGYDRALLVLDIAELHLDRGDLERAHELARSSFGVLAALRKDDEAYQAMQIFYRAGVALALDRAMVDRVREQLLDLQRRPRASQR